MPGKRRRFAELALMACAAAMPAAAQRFEFAFVPWGAADVAVAPVRAADPKHAPMVVSIERQPPEALLAWTGSKRLPAGLALYLLTVCGIVAGPAGASPGQVRQALAARGVSMADEMITRHTLRLTRSTGASVLDRLVAVLEIAGPGIIAAAAGDAIKLRPREVAALAALVTGGKLLVEAGRDKRQRERAYATEIDQSNRWLWALPASIDLSNGKCSETVAAIGAYQPGSPKAMTIPLEGVN